MKQYFFWLVQASFLFFVYSCDKQVINDESSWLAPEPDYFYSADSERPLPTSQGWLDFTSSDGYGRIVSDMGTKAWEANGVGGRAQWKINPDISMNMDASNVGWKMTVIMRMVSGNYITNYYANGEVRFLPIIELDEKGDLIATIEGGSSHILVKGTGGEEYHTYEVEYDPKIKLATFRFDGVDIVTWAGQNTTQNMIVWGNGSTTKASVAYYRYVGFDILGERTTNTIFKQDVFIGGVEGPNGTSNYRIPSLITAADGSLLAFAEGRASGSDAGHAGYPIKMVMKRSTDNGTTWSEVQIIHENDEFDYSDPRIILNEQNGKLYLFYTQWPDNCGQRCVPQGLDDNSSNLFLRTSDDNGQTWSEAMNLNQQVKDPTWRALNCGPGIGIQLKNQIFEQGGHNGRLIIPGLRVNRYGEFNALSIFSDDEGQTWKPGNEYSTLFGTNESEIVELNDGQLLLSSRGMGSDSPNRGFYTSDDGGVNWNVLNTPVVNITRVDASMIRYSSVKDGDSINRILFSAPMGSPPGSGSGRYNLGIWVSYDEGKTFADPVQITSGFSAYSAICKLKDGSVGVLYEKESSTRISFLRFDISEVEKR
jgi:sialidase-1